MRKMASDSRSRLLRAAENVSYKQGFEKAALADIARKAGVPLGNVYYYFKTKNDIGKAIIDLRLFRFKRLLQELNKTESPKARLCGFVQIKINNRKNLARFGCPVGTLCSELHKENASAVARRSTALFAEALAWMESQFKALGKGAESRALAVHLLSATQGISVLAHTFHDPEMITGEAMRLKEWILSL